MEERSPTDGVGSLGFGKKLVFAGVLVSMGLFAGLFVLEVVLRSVFDVHRCDEELGWTFRPNASVVKTNRELEFFQIVRFNSHGFHDVDRAYEKPEDVFRILLLGQSIAAGLQVAQPNVFSALLETSLGQALAPGRRIEVINASTDGYSNAQQLLLYRSRVSRYRPDVVLLTSYLANDIADNSWEAGSWNHYIAKQCGRPYFRLEGSALELVEAGAPQGRPATSPLQSVLGRSRIYLNFFATSDNNGQGPAFDQGQVYHREQPEGVRRSWELTKRLLLEFRSELEREGVPLVVLPFPFEHTTGLRGSKRAKRTSPRGGFDFVSPRVRLLEFLDANSIDFIELLPAMKRHHAEGGKNLYFRADSHLTVAGHRFVAEQIHAWLLSRCGPLQLPLEGCVATP